MCFVYLEPTSLPKIWSIDGVTVIIQIEFVCLSLIQYARICSWIKRRYFYIEMRDRKYAQQIFD